MYSKEVTAVILSDWAKGASAEETIVHLKEKFGRSPCLNTIYTHRNGLTAEMLVDELLRQQERDITKADNPALRMKYRDLLLAKLLPQKIEQKIEGGESFKVEIIDNSTQPKDNSVPPASPAT
jgi:hypothetical protein